MYTSWATSSALSVFHSMRRRIPKTKTEVASYSSARAPTSPSATRRRRGWISLDGTGSNLPPPLRTGRSLPAVGTRRYPLGSRIMGHSGKGGRDAEADGKCGVEGGPQGRTRIPVAGKRSVRGKLFVRLALRGGEGNESRGADRSRPRGVLLDGARGGAGQGRARSEARQHDRERRSRHGRWPAHRDHHPRHGGGGTGNRGGRVPRAGRRGQAELSGLQGARRRRHPAERPPGLIRPRRAGLSAPLRLEPVPRPRALHARGG